MIYIYVLRCPMSGAIRYVGKTCDPAKRVSAHMRAARQGERHHRATWLRSLIASGVKPMLEVIYTLDAGECWQEIESRFIAEYRAAGHPLTNGTDGGDGLHRPSADILARMAEASRKRAALPGVRGEMSRAAKAVWDRLTATERAAWCEAHARAAKAAWSDPAVRAARVAMLQSPQVKAKRYANRDTPEKTAARIEKLKAAWADPERRARRLAAMQSPEYKAKIAARSRDMHARRKAQAAQ